MAVVGAGAFGHNHLRVLRELETAGEGVALVAAVDPDAGRAEEAKQQLEQEIAERRQLEAQLRRMATTDGLTGTLNHAQFLQLGQRELEQLRAGQRHFPQFRAGVRRRIAADCAVRGLRTLHGGVIERHRGAQDR